MSGLTLTPAEEQALKQLLARELTPPARKRLIAWAASSARTKITHARGRLRKAALAFLLAGSSCSGGAYLYGAHQLAVMFLVAGAPAAAIVLLGGDPNSYGNPLTTAAPPTDEPAPADSAPTTGEGADGGA